MAWSLVEIHSSISYLQRSLDDVFWCQGPYYKNINKLLVNMMRIFAAVNKDDDSEDDDSKGEEIKPMSTKKEPASETETGVLERAGTSCSPDYFVSDIDISRLVASLMCMVILSTLSTFSTADTFIYVSYVLSDLKGDLIVLLTFFISL